MPFSDDFHVHRFRGTKLSGLQGTPDKLGVLTFTKSTDHSAVTSYEVRIYSQGGSTILASRNIGKPVPYSNGDILVDLTSLLAGLANGNYTIKVLTTSSGGATESSGDDFMIPLS